MSSPLTPETSSTAAVSVDPDAGVNTESVTTDAGGEQLSDPVIVTDDAKNQAAPVPGPVGSDPLNSNGTQTVQNN